MRVHMVAAGKYHDIDFARLELLKILAETPSLRTTVAADYSNSRLIADADILLTYTCDLVPDAAQTEVIAEWLAAGGRWIALHGTNSILRFGADGVVETPDEAPQFMALLGTQFAGHPPIGAYKVDVTRADHPLTAGMRPFKIVDELYLTRRTGDIDVLLHTEFHGTCPEFGAQQWEDKQVPVLYERTVGKGKIAYLTLGHCRGHYDLQPLANFYPHPERCAWNYPIYYELLRRSVQWAMRKD